MELIHGECLSEMSNLINRGVKVDMILCDLPYGVTRNKWDSPIDLDELWDRYEKIIKDNGVIVLTAQTPFDKILGASKIKWLRYEWIWEKPNASGQLNAKRMPLKAHENILVFYKSPPPLYNPQWLFGDPYTITRNNYKGSSNYGKQSDHTTVSDGRRYPRSVIKFGRDKDKIHPTQKPVALCEYLIKTYTNPGDVVLDNCMGSGTTGVACRKSNRDFIGIEMDQKYFEIAKSRIESCGVDVS